MLLDANLENIQRAAAVLRDGGLVAFPTETVYGLGANALNEQAVQRVFELKGRPLFNPLIVHVSGFSELYQIGDVSGRPWIEGQLAKLRPLFPGPISVVLPHHDAIPDIVTGGTDSVAVRVPDHPVAQKLLAECRCPVAAPSANRFSEVSPTRAQHVLRSLSDGVDIILDGGACRVGVESTVLSLLEELPCILRHGGVTFEVLEGLLGEVRVCTSVAKGSRQLRSPGLLLRHYSPKTPLAIRDELKPIPAGVRAGLLTFKKKVGVDFAGFFVVQELSKEGDLGEVAANLYAALREMDEMGLELIVVDSCCRDGLGAAIMDRLERAQHGAAGG